MRFLNLCFVLMVLGFSAKAQDKETCFYHVSFYEWHWEYSSSLDTLPEFGYDRELRNDTITFETANHPTNFILDHALDKSFDSAQVKVMSCDGKIQYHVKGFKVTQIRPGKHVWPSFCLGSLLPKMIATDLQKSMRGDVFILGSIRIFDQVLKKEILLPGITIYVE